jgi:hypothetical protein
MDCKSKVGGKSQVSGENQSTEALDKGGDMYLASTSTQSEHDVWLIDSGASFSMTSHREWFC